MKKELMNEGRRTFLTNTLAVSILSSLSFAGAASSRRLPARLRPGITVGILAPASNVEENEIIHFAKELVESLGFKVILSKHIFERNQYLAGNDQQRADDINTFFLNKDIDAIMCLRGGYGTPRILPLINYQAIANNPKVLIGYSDITALLNAIYVKTGLVCFHGPMASQNFSEYTLAEFKKVLVSPQPNAEIAAPPPCEECREGFVERENRLTTFAAGKAKGKLIGGNLSLLVTLLGTRYQPNFEGAILFLEDVGEPPYRVDRMLTHLLLSGALSKCAGVVFGKFTDAKTDENSFSMEAVLKNRTQFLNIPVVRGLMIGHVDDQTCVPLGVMAELDADKRTLTLLEAAVS